MVPDIAAILHRDIVACTFNNKASFDAWAVSKRFVCIGLHRDVVLRAAQCGVLGNQDFALGIVYAVTQGIRAERAEYNRVNCTDTGTGQTGDRRLRNHLQVEADTVAFLYTGRFERVGKFADLGIQLVVGQFRIFGRVVAFPNDCGLVAARRQMAI